MSRVTNWIAIGFLLAAAPWVFAQQQQLLPRFPEDTLAFQQLIAWSRLQKPQPTPQPLPPRDTPVPQPDQQNQAYIDQTGNSETSASIQAFTGRIVKDGGRHVLRVASNASYQLADQGDLSRYEDQQVRIVGVFDTASNTVRVAKIEPIR